MNKKNKFILLLIPFYIISTGFFSLSLTGNIKKDGSGTLSMFYSGTIKEVEQYKYSFGYFPFGKENITKNFSNNLVNISNLKIANLFDSAYTVKFDLNFNNLLDLTELKGFSDMEIELLKADKDSELNWQVIGNDRTKLLNDLDINLTFEDNIISSNGLIKDKTVTWHITDFSENTNLNVMIANNIFISNNRSIKDTSKNLKPKTEKIDKDYSYEEKPCGIWGLELPIILFLGLFFSFGRKKFRL